MSHSIDITSSSHCVLSVEEAGKGRMVIRFCSGQVLVFSWMFGSVIALHSAKPDHGQVPSVFL